MKPTKQKSKLIGKTEVVEGVVEVEFSYSTSFDFIPGQFANIAVTPPFRRPYSILSKTNESFKFLIDIRNPGKGADFFRNAQVGDETEITYPLGRFQTLNNDLEKIYVATGVGIAPFIPMILEQIEKGRKIKLFHGIRFEKDDLALKYLHSEIEEGKIEYFQCLSGEESSSKYFKKGRVTSVLPTQILDWDNSEFYICGANKMVKDMKELLLQKGIQKDRIILENWG